MRFLLRFIIFLFLLKTFSFCKEKVNPTITEDLFIKSEEFSITRSEYIGEFDYVSYIDTDTLNLFIGLSANNNMIFIYNYETKELLHQINVPIKGGNINAFYFENLNTIYFVLQNNFSIYKISYLEKIECVFCPDQEEMGYLIQNFDLGMYMEFTPTQDAPIYKVDSTLYITSMLWPKAPLDKQKPFYIITFTQDDFVFNSKIGSLPAQMIRNDSTLYPFDNKLSYTRNNKKENIFSYAPDDNLYIYNDTILISEINCKSRFRTTKIPFINIKDIHSSEIIKKRYFVYDSYLGIYYDKYNDVYYRTIKLAQENHKSKDKLLNFDYIYSIMVLDNEFNIIEEQLFDSKEYIPNSLIITKDGIMLKKPDDLSGISRYTIFKLNKDYLK